MKLFSKPEYMEVMLPFLFAELPEDHDEGIISIEAYGNVCGKDVYCYAAYSLRKFRMYGNGDYDRMLDMLRSSDGKTVKVRFKIKNGIPKDFRIDIPSIAAALEDERFLQLELGGWGMHEKSVTDQIKES